MSEPHMSAMYRSGAGDYHTYRIPAMVVSGRGTVLAFCEGRRGYAWSDNGGHSWTEVAYDDALPELSCQGSVIGLGGSSVLTANVADTQTRGMLTVRRSDDGCRTWPIARVLYAGSAAYCDLTVTAAGEILCLFEADDYSSLRLARFAPTWLEETT